MRNSDAQFRCAIPLRNSAARTAQQARCLRHALRSAKAGVLQALGMRGPGRLF